MAEIRKRFLRRAARGKKDSLTVSFGEHASAASSWKFSKLLSRHRGLYVFEHAEGLDSKSAKKHSRGFDALTRGAKWDAWIESMEPGFVKEDYKDIKKLYLEKRGKATISEIFLKREIKRYRELISLEEKEERTVLDYLNKKDILSAMARYNRALDISAEMERIRNKLISRNLSKTKGNVLARYGTAHSLLFRGLKLLRPDAKRVFEEGAVLFPKSAILTRLKQLGKGKNPPIDYLIKAYVGENVSAPLLLACESLGISMDNPKAVLFFNALADALPQNSLESILRRVSPQKRTYPFHIFEELLFANKLPENFLSLKPMDKLKLMKSFASKVYGPHSKLYKIAYRS